MDNLKKISKNWLITSFFSEKMKKVGDYMFKAAKNNIMILMIMLMIMIIIMFYGQSVCFVHAFKCDCISLELRYLCC